MEPRVSVVMPTYRGEAFIAEAIESILGQTFEDFELIVVHQPSGDATSDILAGIADDRVRVITRPEPGLAASHNTGFDDARGEYVAVMDDDDISLPHRLEVEVGYLDDNPDVDAVCSTFMYIDAEGRRLVDRPMDLYPGDPPPFEYLYTIGNFIPNDSAMFRRTDLRYDEGVPSAIDVMFWLEFLVTGRRIHQFEEPLLLARRTGDHHSSRYSIEEKLSHRLLIKRLVRERYGVPRRLYLRGRSMEYMEAALLYANVSRSRALRYVLLAFLNNPLNGELYGRVSNRMRKSLGMRHEEHPELS
jgi:glycosyltransferase involved in cell wall biosynthesis